MSRGRTVGFVAAGVAVAAVAAGVVVFGVVGVGQTVSAGAQTQVCGVPIGVSVSDDRTVRLLGASDEALAPGDRVRVSPLCVVEVVDIQGEVDPDADGGGARVELRWRLW